MEDESSIFCGEKDADPPSRDQAVPFEEASSTGVRKEPFNSNEEQFLYLESFVSRLETTRARNSPVATSQNAVTFRQQHQFPLCDDLLPKDPAATCATADDSSDTKVKSPPQRSFPCSPVTDLVTGEHYNAASPCLERAPGFTTLAADVAKIDKKPATFNGAVVGGEIYAHQYNTPSPSVSPLCVLEGQAPTTAPTNPERRTEGHWREKQSYHQLPLFVQNVPPAAHPSTSQTQVRALQPFQSKASSSSLNPARETTRTALPYNHSRQQYFANNSVPKAHMVVINPFAPAMASQQTPVHFVPWQYHASGGCSNMLMMSTPPTTTPLNPCSILPGMPHIPAGPSSVLPAPARHQGEVVKAKEDRVAIAATTVGAGTNTTGEEESVTNISAVWEEEFSSGSSSPKKRKPRDPGRPKKPLSAYNIFFKEERTIMIREIEMGRSLDELETSSSSFSNGGGGVDETTAANGTENTSDEIKRQRKRMRVGISFEEMAKNIGKRWKSVHPDRLAEYRRRADLDKQRYAKEMAAYAAGKKP